MAERDERFSEAYIIRSVPRSQSPCSVADSLSLSLPLSKGEKHTKGGNTSRALSKSENQNGKRKREKRERRRGKIPSAESLFPLSLFRK